MGIGLERAKLSPRKRSGQRAGNQFPALRDAGEAFLPAVELELKFVGVEAS